MDKSREQPGNSVDSTTARPSSVSSPNSGALAAQTLALVVQLVDATQRRAAALALAAHLGAMDLIVFIEDPEVDMLLPAPGFPQTLPRARLWRAFLARSSELSYHQADLPFPDAATMTPAIGIVRGGAALVLLGGTPHPADVQEICQLLPLLGAALRGEQAAQVAAAQAALARKAAAQAEVLAASLDAARRDLQAALRARDEFLLSITHDLKTPLAAIKGLAQVLGRQLKRSSLPEAEKLADRLGLIDSTATKMAGMINALLDLARVQLGEPLDLDLRPTDLVALVRQLVAEQQQISGRHPFRIAITEPELTGLWDTDRLERALTNLLANAIKYSPNGGDITVTLMQEERGDGPWAVLSVQDRGIGIPAADLPHIFERFHRAGNAIQLTSGTGIGLASARQIIEQHGGAIAVTSEEGAGSTFTVQLPLAPPEPIL
jgi:signal transduction histidine kinase